MEKQAAATCLYAQEGSVEKIIRESLRLFLRKKRQNPEAAGPPCTGRLDRIYLNGPAVLIQMEPEKVDISAISLYDAHKPEPGTQDNIMDKEELP